MWGSPGTLLVAAACRLDRRGALGTPGARAPTRSRPPRRGRPLDAAALGQEFRAPLGAVARARRQRPGAPAGRRPANESLKRQTRRAPRRAGDPRRTGWSGPTGERAPPGDQAPVVPGRAGDRRRGGLPRRGAPARRRGARGRRARTARRKAHGICHGTSGNGFALLKAFARTGDELWLDRARRFAVHALAQADARAARPPALLALHRRRRHGALRRRLPRRRRAIPGTRRLALGCGDGEELGRAARGGGRRAGARGAETAPASSRVCATRSRSRAARSPESSRRPPSIPATSADWERLEEALIAGDVGVRATAELVRRLEAARRARRTSAPALAEEIAALFGEPPTLDLDARARPCSSSSASTAPARRRRSASSPRASREHGRSVVVAAADTFRAAAEEQLEIWAQRAGADFVGSERGADPAAVAYDAIEAAQARGRDVVIVDTAGRLHTQANLMEELAKVRRVIAGGSRARRTRRCSSSTPPPARTASSRRGSSARRSASRASSLTKLDGSAKGGVAIPIAYELGLPVKLIGVGESLDDLRPFDPHDYARALVAG